MDRILFPTLLAALLGLCGAFPPPSAYAAGDDEIPRLLDRVAAAHGGREALVAFPGFRVRAKILSIADGMNGKLRLAVSLDGSLRADIVYPNRKEVRILSGDLAWNGNPREQKFASTAMARSMQLQYHRLVAPFELAEADPADFRTTGSSSEGWTLLRRDWTDELSMTYEVDPATGRIPRVTGIVRAGDEELEFVTESSDFREVEGILFPFRTTTIVSGEVAAETILDDVTVVHEFSREIFLPVDGAGDL